MKLITWWKSWGEVTMKLLAFASSVASFLGLLFQFRPSTAELSPWSTVLFMIAALSCIAVVVLELRLHRGRRIYAKSDRYAIKGYMHDWIEHGGRIAIWSRDLSWADNHHTRKLLLSKASRGELILCLPQENEISNELAAAGAEVCAYGAHRLESPASRFTIAYLGRDGARVAVGRADGDFHTIDEFSASNHPAYHLAADLVALARSQRTVNQTA